MVGLRYSLSCRAVLSDFLPALVDHSCFPAGLVHLYLLDPEQ